MKHTKIILVFITSMLVIPKAFSSEISDTANWLFYKAIVSYDSGQYSESAELTSQSAQQGHPTAKFLLAHMYASGLGVDKNVALAELWLKKSSEKGYQAAKVALNSFNQNNQYSHNSL